MGRLNSFLVFTFAWTILNSNSGLAQVSKTIIVTKIPKTVPAGKKWVLEADKITKVQVSYGVSNSGSMCNALFLSNPRITMNVNRGTVSNPEPFSIIFKNLQKVPYENSSTYELMPISFVNKDFSLSELKTRKPEDVGVRKLIFKPGENVFVSNCLESIEMIESNLTPQEIAEEKKKDSEIKKEEEKKALNGYIPISIEKKDSLTKYVFFESPSQLNGGIDSEEKWTITLSSTRFEMKSSNTVKSLSIISSEYKSQYGWQVFQLSNVDGKITHNLEVHYEYSNDTYVLIFRSLDKAERYQFNHLKFKEVQKKK